MDANEHRTRAADAAERLMRIVRSNARVIVSAAVAVTIAVTIAFFIVRQRGRAIERENRQRQLEIDRAAHPAETALLERYAAIVAERLPDVSCALHPPTVIAIDGHSGIREIGVHLDPQSRAVGTITIRTDPSFTAHGFKLFGEIFLQSPPSGGPTAEGARAPARPAVITPDGSIVHDDFTITFADYREPIQAAPAGARQPVRNPVFDPATGRIIPRDGARQPLIGDTEHAVNAGATITVKPPEVVAREITITMKTDRSGVARDVFVRSLQSLLGSKR